MKVSFPLNNRIYTNQNIFNQNKRTTLNQNFSNKLPFLGNYQDTFDFNKIYNEELDKRSLFQKKFGLGKRKAKETAFEVMRGFNMNRNDLEKSLNDTIAAQAQTLENTETLLKAEQEKQKLLKEKLAKAEQEGKDKKRILELEQELLDSNTRINTAEQKIQIENAKFEKMKNTQTALTQQIKGRGWETIAGNGELKDNLNLWFIQKIAVEQGGNKVNFPNSILFYGPQSTGKTRIAKALAQQSQCNYREIDMAFRDNIAKELEEIKKESLDIYKTKGLRTLILMDEFDSATQLTRKEKNLVTKGGELAYKKTIPGIINEFIKDCANKYKCTVLMTTNHPLDINVKFFEDKNCIPYHVYMREPNPKDAQEILKYHIRGFTKEEIDFDNILFELNKTIDETYKGHAFSAGKLASIIAECRSYTDNITENDLISVIKHSKPDITPDMLERFQKEVVRLGKDLS